MVLKLGFTTFTVCSGKNLSALLVEVIIEPDVWSGFILTSVINVSTWLWLQLISVICLRLGTLASLFKVLPNLTIGSLIYPLPACVIVTPLISPSEFKLNVAWANTFVLNKIPSASFACGSGNIIVGAEE